jgi:polyribonucleotide nucleotidyltransferase
MQNKVVRKELELAGRKLSLETGELAGHANAAVLAQYGETVVLVTVVSKDAPPTVDYFPLAVDYEERLYAGGKISSSRFIKREGRPSEKSVLSGRLVDRSIRPLFPTDYQAEVQVIITVLSIDQENDPDILALIGASAALSISDIPWNGPIAGTRVGYKDDKYILNPTETERKELDLDVTIASSEEEIVMIESAAQQVSEEKVAGAFEFGVKHGKEVIKLIEEFTKEAGKEKQKYEVVKLSPDIEAKVTAFIKDEIMKNFDKDSQDDGWFKESTKKLEAEFLKDEKEAGVAEPVPGKLLSAMLEVAVTDKLRDDILTHGKRPDGRKPDEIRELNIKVGVLPRTHGSAIFQRGETQVLSVATLGSPSLEQIIDGMDTEYKKRYMHHYNFPPYSSGEVKRVGSPGRREIGHGALAEKALVTVIPDSDTFPYTIRVVSECLSSAGSTSMAATCGSTLALMDAGVPLKEIVAGISIGLITDKKDRSKYVTLTDIAYQEDAQGDMDFKITGTKNGITAIQMDIKLNGISLKIAFEALEAAKKARLTILDAMLKVLPAPREKVSQHAPTVILVKIDPTKIGEVIGSGGRIINKIISETGAQIDINDEGTVMISSKDVEACQKAAKWVEGIVKEPELGEVFEGPVKRILPFGAMVEIMPGKEGLVHISKLANERVEKVEDVVKIGDIVKVKVAEIDDMGRVNLAMENVDLSAKREDSRPSGGSGYRGSRPGGDRRGGGGFDRGRPPRKRY